MTPVEMHREFDITFDKVSSEAYPEIKPIEKDFYINEAISRYIKTRYGGNNPYHTSFEETQKRIDDLKNLVVTKYCSFSTVPYYDFNCVRAELNTMFDDENLTTQTSNEYMFYVKCLVETCNSNETCCRFHSVNQVQQDDLAKIISDPFNKPKGHKPILFFEDSDIFISAGTSPIKNILVTYIRKPAIVSLGYNGSPAVSCDLSNHTHKEIVQLAVRIALENLESPRTQTQQVNINESE